MFSVVNLHQNPGATHSDPKWLHLYSTYLYSANVEKINSQQIKLCFALFSKTFVFGLLTYFLSTQYKRESDFALKITNNNIRKLHIDPWK